VECSTDYVRWLSSLVRFAVYGKKGLHLVPFFNSSSLTQPKGFIPPTGGCYSSTKCRKLCFHPYNHPSHLLPVLSSITINSRQNKRYPQHLRLSEHGSFGRPWLKELQHSRSLGRQLASIQPSAYSISLPNSTQDQHELNLPAKWANPVRRHPPLSEERKPRPPKVLTQLTSTSLFGIGSRTGQISPTTSTNITVTHVRP